ncbi:MAG: hypothetical protein HYZ53_03230 [Planctomycetes bacterium]|nr:hypothetical protein [Planctomycetota bacterium]
MGVIGFSTGALAAGDFRSGLAVLRRADVRAVEVSALREHEFLALARAWSLLELDAFSYVSIHLPSRLIHISEAELVGQVLALGLHRFPLIVHADTLRDFDRWAQLGSSLCIENTDKRKRCGQTAKDLGALFTRLPRASLCFDIGHARQVDPTLSHAVRILREFGDRLRQVHVSEVNSQSRHEPVTRALLSALGRVGGLIPPATPMILETPLPLDLQRMECRGLEDERKLVSSVFADWRGPDTSAATVPTGSM